LHNVGERSMSKEEYLKGEKKEKVLDLIRKYMAYRMTSEEILSNLETKGYKVSDRTLRRYKHDIQKTAGETFSEIFRNEIMVNIVEDIYTIKELQREGWQEYNKSKASHEKLKALSLVRNLTLDKLKLHSLVPLSYKMGPKQKLHSSDELDDATGDDSKDLVN